MNQLAVKKAYEISYALFRIAGATKSVDLARVLERSGTALLDLTLDGSWDEVALALDKSIYFLRLGRDVGVVGHINVSVLEQELERFKASIREFRSSTDSLPDLHLESYFSPTISGIMENGKRADSGNGKKVIRQASNLTAEFNGLTSDQSERQESIVSLIRKSGNCRSKDLQDVLPEVSERTLRYDLQKLLDKGVIERSGGGGPATFYRMKSSATPASSGAGSGLATPLSGA